MRGNATSVAAIPHATTSCNDPSAPALQPARTALFERGHARGHGRHGPAAADARCRVCAGARAKRRLGIIPKAAAKPIGECLRGRALRYRSARRSGGRLRQHRHSAGQGADRGGQETRCRCRAATFIGARPARTSSTPRWCSICARPSTRWCSDLDRAIAAFSKIADKHRKTPTVARTWLQQALPMPFGLKAAGYAAALARSRERLKRLRDEALVLQFGGAAGTLAALGERGLDVADETRTSTQAAAAGCARGTAIATGSARWPAPSPFSPAPAERSRATSRS